MNRLATEQSPTFSPLYRQIRELLTRSLESGEWRPGAMIPSEAELAARFGPAYLRYKRATPFLLPRVPRR